MIFILAALVIVIAMVVIYLANMDKPKDQPGKKFGTGPNPPPDKERPDKP